MKDFESGLEIYRWQHDLKFFARAMIGGKKGFQRPLVAGWWTNVKFELE